MEPQQYLAMVLRTAVILKTANAPDVAGVFLDRLKRQQFLAEWSYAIEP